MKKGSAFTNDDSGGYQKRKRTTEGTGPFGNSDRGPVSMAGLSIGGRFGAGGREDLLGGASKDWTLPEITSPDIHIAQSWNAAFEDADEELPDASFQKPAPQQSGKSSMLDSTNAPKGQPTGAFGGMAVHAVSTPNTSSAATSMMNSTATVVTASSAGMSSLSSVTPSLAGTSVSNFSSSTGSSNNTGFQTARGVPPPPPPAAAAGAVPKAVLYTYYGKKPRRKQLANEDYFTWNNGGRPHELRFTGIFQCPLTGECFPSGRQGDPKYYSVVKATNKDGVEVDVVWYTKKTFAEHGAAARCYDCLTYRQALEGEVDPNVEGRLGIDPPYKRGEGPALPPTSANIEQTIVANKQRIQSMMMHVEGSSGGVPQQQQQQQGSGQAQAKEPWFVIPQK